VSSDSLNQRVVVVQKVPLDGEGHRYDAHLPWYPGVGTALRASTRVHDDDGGSSFGTERDAAQSISVKDSSAIIEGGLRTVVTVSAESREVGDAQQGRIRAPLVLGRGFHCGQPG